MTRRTPGPGIGGALVLIALSVLITISPLPPATVERLFSRGWYPRVQGVLTSLSNLSSIALLDIGVAIGLGSLALLFVLGLRAGGWRRGMRAAGAGLLRIVAVVYLVFLFLWGLNYRRIPLEEKLAFDRGRVTQQNASALAAEAVRRLNAMHAGAHAVPFDRAKLAAPFADAERILGAPRPTVLGHPKRSLAALYMRKAAFDGLTNPVFLEVILNPDLLPVEQPETLAHEWAHLAGYADESEASFLAWLTCLRGDTLAQYSGWLSAYSRAVNVLPRPARSALPRLDEGPRQDFDAIAARFRRSSPIVRKAAREVYDSYLKANRIQEGIANYDAVLQLMLGTDLGRGWTASRLSR